MAPTKEAIVHTIIFSLSALISPPILYLGIDKRGGKGAKHRTPGLPRIRPNARAGRHVLVRPRPELYADEVSW
jgi:hypothetical protein